MTVVTRFAPSPTGYLHIGGARTALFCWLYARHTGGKFLLRIEDTDRERSTQAAVDALLDGLTWLGLNGDEPPVYQSRRAARHAEIANELVKRGAAYRSYESVEELEAVRQSKYDEQQRLLDWRNAIGGYRSLLAKNLQKAPEEQVIVKLVAYKLGGNSFLQPSREFGTNEELYRWLTNEQIAASARIKELSEWLKNEEAAATAHIKDASRPFRSEYRERLDPPFEGAPCVVRLRMPDEGELTIDDKVQGSVTQKYQDLDDLILLRSDGTPTYLLAVVVDDHDSGVTHVIRGDDHLTNTFRQIPIIDGMAWQRPEYAHVPLIHGPDGKKLSKSHGATGVNVYRDELGYLPEGLKNYLLRLGWSHGDDEIISEKQAIEWFDLDGLNKAPARLDFKKLDAVNQYYMAQADDQRLFDLFQARPAARGLSQDALARIRNAMPVLKTRSPNLVAMAEQARFLTDIRPIVLSGKAADLLNDEARDRIAGLMNRLEALEDWSEPTIREELTQYCAQIGIGLDKIGPVLRAVLTGGAPSPDISLVLALLGRNEGVARMKDRTSARD